MLTRNYLLTETKTYNNLFIYKRCSRNSCHQHKWKLECHQYYKVFPIDMATKIYLGTISTSRKCLLSYDLNTNGMRHR